MTVVTIILIAVNAVIIWYMYQMVKLNKIYIKRFAKEEHIEQLLEEKPNDVVRESELMTSDLTFNYIGSMDNPVKKEFKDGYISSKDGELYLYKEGKWYMIVNDLPHIDYRLKYYKG